MRAALYTRVSSDKQEIDGTSLDTQLESCRAYAVEHGYDIAGEFTDTWTGSQYRERPGLSDLRALVRAGGVDVVLCHALDRLSRDQTHMAVLVDEIEHAGARLELVTESFDDSATGKLIRSVQAFAAELERAKIIERSTRGRQARVAAGKYLPGRKVKYGYQWADDEHAALDIEPETALIVRRIFSACADGQSLRAIAGGLTDDGIPTPMGRPKWAVSTLRLMLRDRAYTGEAYGWKSGDEAIPLPAGTVPALVDVATFEAAGRYLDRNKRRATRRNRQPERSLLRAGFVVCAICGRAMSVQNTGSGGEGHYRCINNGHSLNIRRDPLDTAVVERVRWLLEHPDALEHAPPTSALHDPTGELDLIDRTLASIDRKRANLGQSVADTDDADTRAVLVGQLEQLSARRRELEDERAVVAGQVERYHVTREIIEGFDVWRRKVAVVFEHGDYQERRAVLDELRIRVTVWPLEHAPRWQIASEILPSIVFSSS